MKHRTWFMRGILSAIVCLTPPFAWSACPGTNVVTTPTDAALRAAIQLGGQVRLCFNGTVMLTNTILVDKAVTLDASGMDVTISGGGAVRLFEVATNVSFGLTNLMLTQGRATGALGGAAILSRGGTLWIESCRVNGNTGRDVDGGAIWITSGSLAVRGSQFLSNVVNVSLSTPLDSFFDSRGGAIFAERSAIEITGTLFGFNSLIGDSTLLGSENTPQMLGGAIYFYNPLTTNVLHLVRFLTNSIEGGYTRNGGTADVLGGALASDSPVHLTGCTFLGNSVRGAGGAPGPSTTAGGAMYINSNSRLNGCTFAGNQAVGGSGRITGPSSGFPGATARGGALYISGFQDITNCTFTANTALGGSGGCNSCAAGEAHGGAIVVSGGSATLVNSTVASNFANVPRPFGLTAPVFGMNVAAPTNPHLAIYNSLLAGTGSNVWGSVLDGGYNFSSDGSANFTSGTSFNFTDPQLLPLANQGGPTLTMALAPGSPAIDWTPAASAPATDQRGLPRPVGPAADSGAYEYNAPLPTLLARREAGSVRLEFLAAPGMVYRLEHAGDFPVWDLHELIGPFPAGTPVVRFITPSASAQYFRLKLDY